MKIRFSHVDRSRSINRFYFTLDRGEVSEFPLYFYTFSDLSGFRSELLQRLKTG